MSAEVGAEQPIVEQEKFYQDKSFSLALLALFFLGFTLGLGGLLFLLRPNIVPLPVYFPTTAQGALIAEAPLVESSIEVHVLLNWIIEAMMDSNTFNFINYPAVLATSSVYYTTEGYDSYKNALNVSKVIDRVVQKKLVLKATPTDAPQILLEKPLAGRYMWKIKIPMQFRYQSVTTDVSDSVEINLIVMRVPTTQSPNGVSILKYDIELKERG